MRNPSTSVPLIFQKQTIVRPCFRWGGEEGLFSKQWPVIEHTLVLGSFSPCFVSVSLIIHYCSLESLSQSKTFISVSNLWGRAQAKTVGTSVTHGCNSSDAILEVNHSTAHGNMGSITGGNNTLYAVTYKTPTDKGLDESNLRDDTMAVVTSEHYGPFYQGYYYLHIATCNC